MSVKVLSIVPTKNLMGGGEKSFFELLKYMQEKGYENYVIIPLDSSEDMIEEMGRHNIKCIKGEYKAFTLHKDQSLQKFLEAIQISKIIKDVLPDVFMTNLYVDPSQRAAALCNVPHVYFDRGHLGLLKNRGILPDQPPKFIKYANAIVCNSMGGQNILKGRYNTESSLVYSYVETPKVRLSDNKTTRIIIPANFFEEKNHIDILMAIYKLTKKQKKFDTKVFFMGSTVNATGEAHLRLIKDKILELNLSGLVEIMDHRKDPWSFFSKNDIYINSGESEAVGRATTEAELLGITALISDIDGHIEHREIMKNPYTFKLHDIDDLAQKIEEILKTPAEERVKIIVSIQKKAQNWMTKDNAMGGILEVVERVRGEENVASVLVYDELLQVIDKSIRNQEKLKTEVGKFCPQDESADLGVKDSIKQLAVAIKRKYNLLIDNYRY